MEKHTISFQTYPLLVCTVMRIVCHFAVILIINSGRQPHTWLRKMNANETHLSTELVDFLKFHVLFLLYVRYINCADICYSCLTTTVQISRVIWEHEVFCYHHSPCTYRNRTCAQGMTSNPLSVVRHHHTILV